MDKYKLKNELEELLEAKELINIRIAIIRYKLKRNEDPRSKL